MRARVSPALPADIGLPTRQNDGYTIVEVVLVIVILAILGALAGPRFFDNAAFNERAYYDELVAAVRYAQKVSVASGCRVEVDITPLAYSLSQQTPQAGHCDPLDASFPVPVRLSTGEVVTGAAPAGVTALPATTFVYDALGRTNLAANRTLTIGSRTVMIQAESGLVVTP